jgi:pimeloyl-ACP methyl ester carboxylesterase
MRGVCGERYHEVLLNSLGKEGLDNAIAESAYFFKDEVPAVQEWNFDAAQAARIHQPVLCLEGGAQPAHLATMASQISERTAELLKQTRIQVLPGVNHAMPLQDPASVAWAIAQFVAQAAR